ncbi:MAG: BMP family ABC transporter substrate-binding protein [Lachnospiraceae bacterium]|nr:BMP family ABC transporter substrate-binding protein [Lachnospiraceae bacterium]
MKFKIFHKNLTVISIIFLAFIMIILIGTELIFDKKKSSKEKKNCNIALITYDEIDEAYFKLILKGVENAAASLDKEYLVFSVGDYKGSYEDTLKAAVDSKASVIVLPDATFEEVVYNCQNQYVNTCFLMIDAIPHNSDHSDNTASDNVISVMFDEAEVGFFAGYAAVSEGYDKLSFICDDTMPKSIRYCYGFLQGADYAAIENDVKDIEIDMIHLSENVNIEQTIKSVDQDVDLVATSSMSLINVEPADSALPSGSETTSDQDNTITSYLSGYPVMFLGGYNLDTENVVATVTNDISSSVNDSLIDFFADNLDGGSIVNFDTKNNKISFVSETGYFNQFSEEKRKALSLKILNNEITIISDTTVSAEELDLEHIVIKENKAP